MSASPMNENGVKPLELTESERSPEAVRRRLVELETRQDLLKWRVGRWCAWALLRTDAALALDPRPALLKVPGRWALLRSAAGDARALITARRAAYLAKTWSTGRSEQQGALYKDPQIDDLLLALGSYCKLESVNNTDFVVRSRQALIKSDLTTSLFELLARRLVRTGRPQAVVDVANRLSDVLVRQPGLEGFTRQRVRLSLLHFHWSKTLFGWLLWRVRPRCVLMTTCGEHAMIAAARERNITAVEFQHGVVNRTHLAYSWSSYARPYKRALPIPDRVFLYGEYWRQELAETGFWDTELRPVGSLRMDQYRAAAGKKPAAAVNILVTTGIENERMLAFMGRFVELAESQIPYHLYFKLHPGYDTDKTVYEAAFRGNPRVSVLLGSEPPSTFTLLTQAHLHVSVASTCHYEALGLRVPTVILPFRYHEIVLHLHTAGAALLAQTPDELVEFARQAAQSSIPASVGDQYFRANALENITQELRTLGLRI